MEPLLRMQLLGDFCLSLNGTPLDAVDAPRIQSLLAYLMLHRDIPQPRRFLAFCFWPDSTEEQALTNLRNVLHHVRHALPQANRYLHIDTRTLQWRSDCPWMCDVADFEKILGEAQIAIQHDDEAALQNALVRAVDLYHGDLLPSCYDDWIMPERERLRQAFIETLEQLIRLLEDQREYQAAVRYAQRLLRCDPLHEVTYRQLMRLYALSGNRAAAIRTYHTCATVLDRELAVEPDLRTQETYGRLLETETKPVMPLPPQIKRMAAIPLTGREQEWLTLHRTYRASAAGEPCLVLLSGEAGIGKTRLAEELLFWANNQGIPTAAAYCYDAEGELPYAPVATWLRAFPRQPLEPVWQAEVTRLLPELQVGPPNRPESDPSLETWQRQRLFEGLTRAILSGRQPLVLLLDDIQWCDRDTLEWLHYLLRFDPLARLLIVATLRIETLAEKGPLKSFLDALRHSDQLVEIEVKPLTEAATFALAKNLTGRDLDPTYASPLYQGSEGNPLFIVEMVQMSPDGNWFAHGNHFQDTTYAAWQLPPKVRTVLEARLRQLSPSARELASVAATIGREFTFTLLSRVSGRDEDRLVRDLDELWRRRILREQGTEAYDFSHGMIREVAYEALSAVRRRRLHHLVALALEAGYGEYEEAEYAQVAFHYERGGFPESAIPFYFRAGEVAQRTYAFAEAVTYLSKALELLKAAPETPDQIQTEFELLVALGIPLILTKGHAAPEVGANYNRAWALCDQVGAAPQRFQVLVGLRRFHLFRGELRKARILGEQMITQAATHGDPAQLSRAKMMHAETLYRMGDFIQTHELCDAAYRLYDPIQQRSHLYLYGMDTGVCSLIFRAMSLWYLGYPDQALSETKKAIVLVDEVNHPFTSSMGLFFIASLHRLRRDPQSTLSATEAALQIAAQYGFAQPLALCSGFQGWAMAMLGQKQTGIELILHCLEACQSIGAMIEHLNLLGNLTGIYCQSGDIDKAESTLADAFAWMEVNEERSWEAELHRLQGEIFTVQHNPQAAEAAYLRAIDVARRQAARMFELRATVCLSRLWFKQGKSVEAQALLYEIYHWFSEGFDAVDLLEARALLDETALKNT